MVEAIYVRYADSVENTDNAMLDNENWIISFDNNKCSFRNSKVMQRSQEYGRSETNP